MAGRLVLTNGDQMMYADWRGEEYDTEASLPTYDTMVEEFFKMEELAEITEHEHDHEGGCCGGHDHNHEGGCCGGHDGGCGCNHK